MASEPSTPKEPPATIASVRAVAGSVADHLADRGFPAEAQTLRAAVELRSTPPDELLVLREALVVTRPTWQAIPGESAAAARALADAKRLAISL